MADTPNFTDRQAKYFATLRASLEPTTGKRLEEWVAIARTCPETAHRARLSWLKQHHGLLQNRASYVLDEAFGSTKSWNDADSLIDALWSNAACRSLYEAIDVEARALPGAIRTARKGYTAWSRQVQFAAAKPLKDGAVMLGLALPPDASPGLDAPRSESWSERLKSRLMVNSTSEVRDRLPGLLRAAWERS